MLQPNQERLDAFLGKMVGDLGAIATGAGVVLGDRLGLFKAMREGGRMTAKELAARTGTQERLVREWLSGQAAAGYVDYDEDTDRFFLNSEQETVFADEDSPAFMAGAFEVLSALWLDEEKVSQAFRSGKGVGWHEHSACLFRGTERFFRPGYNTNLVKAEDAPKSFADLLDPKWTGKLVKAHPGYSGNIMSATFQIQRDLGWEYLEKLARQKVMQVQSSTDPPKKLALGERAVMVDGNEYNALQLKEAGQPIEIVYPAEGTPMAVGPNAIFKNAPNPNAARLLQSYMFTPECQQLVIDAGALRSVHPGAKEHAGRKPFRDIKVMKDDAAGVEKNAEQIKARYSKIFGV